MYGSAGSGSVPWEYSPNGDYGIVPPVREKGIVPCAW